MRNPLAIPAIIRIVFALLVLVSTHLTAPAAVPDQTADAQGADDSVTTRWLPDPFPNVAPRVLDRQLTVEMDTPALRATSSMPGGLAFLFMQEPS